MEEKERKIAEEEAMNKLVKEILKNGDVKIVFDVESKLKQSFGKVIQSMLEEIYPFVYIDAIHFNVKENGVIGKKAAYVAMGISKEGIKEVLGIYIGENESSKFWMTVFNNLKNRGIKDILILSSDGLTGIKEAIQVAFPKAEHQTCIVHLRRNTLKYVSHKDKYKFAQDLKAIYTASDEEIGKKLMYEVAEKWKEKYPTAMDRWEENWGIISPFFKFSQKIRKMIYTTNSIESLNSCYRRLNKSRNVYPTKDSLMKVLYLSTKKVTKNWTSKVPEWGEVLRELEIIYNGRI